MPDFGLNKHAINVYNCDLVPEFFAVQKMYCADLLVSKITIESAIKSEISEDLELELFNIKYKNIIF